MIDSNDSHSEDIQIVCLPKIQSWVAQGRISADHPITVRELIQSRCVHNVKDGIKLVLESKSFPSETPLTQPLHIVVSRASSSAIAAIEAAGGTVTTRYYTETAIKRILRGTMDPMMSLQAPEIMSKAAAGAATTTFRTAVSEKAASTEDSAKDSLTAPSEPAGPWSDPAIPSPAKKFLHRLPDPTSRKDIEYYRDGSHRGYLSHLVPEGQGPSLFFKTPGTGVTKKRAESKGKKVFAGENRLW
jgi:large subunit ribosomal protein L15